jgi:hypothetical protein
MFQLDQIVNISFRLTRTYCLFLKRSSFVSRTELYLVISQRGRVRSCSATSWVTVGSVRNLRNVPSSTVP